MTTLYERLLNGREINMAAESFDRTPTTGIIVFEVLIVLAAILSLICLSRFKQRIGLRFLVVAVGIFIFEMFTAPMWNNWHLGAWAYLYRDVSWILTVGWSTLILLVVVLVDRFCAKVSEPGRFLLSVLGMSLAGIAGESIVIGLGIRSYAPEVQDAIWGYVPLLGVPLNAFFYIPVFMSLVIGFYHYWALVLDGRPVMPMRKRKWARDFLIAFVGILLFEIMVEPMVTNAGLPRWSYVYKDVSFLLTGLWIVIVFLALKFSDHFFIDVQIGFRFVIYLVAIGIIALPIEAWLIAKQIRIYGQSAMDNFTGFKLPGLDVPVEVMFAVPMYFALIVAFIRYWEIILDNRRMR